MLVVAVKNTQKHRLYITIFSTMFGDVKSHDSVLFCHACNLITIFSTPFYYVTPATLLLISFDKKMPLEGT